MQCNHNLLHYSLAVAHLHVLVTELARLMGPVTEEAYDAAADGPAAAFRQDLRHPRSLRWPENYSIVAPHFQASVLLDGKEVAAL